jgi:hypothetical protein
VQAISRQEPHQAARLQVLGDPASAIVAFRHQIAALLVDD